MLLSLLKNSVGWLFSDVSVSLGFFFGEDLFQMDAAVGLVVIDTQQALAVLKLASPTLGGRLQCFCHEYSFRGDFHRTGLCQTDRISQIHPNPTNIPLGAGRFQLVPTSAATCGQRANPSFNAIKTLCGRYSTRFEL